MSYYANLSNEELAGYSELDLDEHFNAIEQNRERAPAILIEIKNRVIRGRYIFRRQFHFRIEFINCYFLGDIIFANCYFERGISIRQSFCDGTLTVNPTAVFEKEFNLVELSVKRQAYVSGGTFNICQWSIVDNGRLVIEGGDFKFLEIGTWGGGSILKELMISFTKVKGIIRITGDKSAIDRLTLTQSSPDVDLLVQDVSVNNFSLYQFNNTKFLRLIRIKPLLGENPSEFTICESFLGKTEFYAIDFSGFNTVNFVDVHWVECYFVSIKWKFDITSFKGSYIYRSDGEKQLEEKIKKIESKKVYYPEVDRHFRESSDVLKYYAKNREIFRQLKFALGKQGDVINEQRFHSKEMRAYNRSITWRTEFWTKVIIKFSYLFSDFGQSIIRPIAGLFAFHFVLVYALILSGHFTELKASLCHPTWAGFVKGTEHYFFLLNPLRKPENDFAGFTVVLDLLMRIWSSYMIYNTIRASRRFIK